MISSKICPSIIIPAFFALLLGSGFAFSLKHSEQVKDKENEFKLRAYQLETERLQVEADLLYLQTLQLSCTEEFINQYGEHYVRRNTK